MIEMAGPSPFDALYLDALLLLMHSQYGRGEGEGWEMGEWEGWEMVDGKGDGDGRVGRMEVEGENGGKRGEREKGTLLILFELIFFYLRERGMDGWMDGWI